MNYDEMHPWEREELLDIRCIRLDAELEEAVEGIPLDENTHLHDYDYDEQQSHLETRKCEEDYIAYLINTGEV